MLKLLHSIAPNAALMIIIHHPSPYSFMHGDCSILKIFLTHRVSEICNLEQVRDSSNLLLPVAAVKIYIIDRTTASGSESGIPGSLTERVGRERGRMSNV